MADDAALFERWCAGDAQAGRVLFERHYESIARFFRNKVLDDWPDLCQRTFLACVEARASFRGEGSFRAFLFGIANFQLRRWYREQSRDRARLDFTHQSAVDLDPTASEVVAVADEQRITLVALRRIPVDHQVILELHYWEEMTAQECAEALGLPVGTAKSRIRRARQLLEEELAQLRGAGAPIRTLSDLDDWVRELRGSLGRA